MSIPKSTVDVVMEPAPDCGPVLCACGGRAGEKCRCVHYEPPTRSSPAGPARCDVCRGYIAVGEPVNARRWNEHGETVHPRCA